MTDLFGKRIFGGFASLSYRNVIEKVRFVTFVAVLHFRKYKKGIECTGKTWAILRKHFAQVFLRPLYVAG
jgi:hypothetical protein